ncbi:MAG TPA: DUF4189 domain-containing protein [Xanthobacteraceae bacterium]|nr:DUF4189 domain-containing protein [Xanthobacteraceae bacterium]
MYPCGAKWGRDAARVFVVLALALVAAIFRPVSGSADGALAIALPPDVVKQGFAYGYVTDYPDVNQADAQALKKCRDTTIEGVRPLCAVIQDFKNQCVAVAMDPQAGTPGVGWSVAPDSRAAEAEALSKCEETAGPGRRAACAIDHSSCDGSAK